MPDPLPARPDFDFFAVPPPVIVDHDTGDESADPFDGIELLFGSRPDYPYRQNFEADVIEELTDELSALTAQLEAARLEWRIAYKTLVLDNPWRVEAVRAGLNAIGAALGVE